MITLFVARFRLSSCLSLENKEENEHMSSVPYVNAVKNIMYAMFYTRPDILHVISVVSRFISSPGKVY